MVLLAAEPPTIITILALTIITAVVNLGLPWGRHRRWRARAGPRLRRFVRRHIVAVCPDCKKGVCQW